MQVTPDAVQLAIRRTEDLPALFPVIQKCLSLLDDPHAGAVQLERILGSDPVTAARVLRLANSAYFGTAAEVRTIPMALNVIGVRRLQVLLRHILATGLIQFLSRGRTTTSEIRERAISASAACYGVAEECDPDRADELSVAGLLHNIGDLALFWCFQREYQTALDLTVTMTLEEAQIRVFGVASGRAGEWLLQGWKFPELFIQVAARWSKPLEETADVDLRRSLEIVHVGVRLAEALACRIAPLSLEIAPEVCTELGLSNEAIRQCYAALPASIDARRSLTS